jgi:mono/diheme cytochrome c family protein
MLRFLILVGLLSLKGTGNSVADTGLDAQQLKRGEYVYHVAGCASCHTAEGGAPLAGGVKMETPFGTFYTPNISADSETGIGAWSDADFIRAMTRGESPRGQHYYPSFPYTSYTHMTRQDLLDLKRYLDAQPAITQANRAHDLRFPFNIRSLLSVWKMLNFDAGSCSGFEQDGSLRARGAYLVNGPGHCAECHSPRNWFGGLDKRRFLQGNTQGPDGESVPGITMDQKFRVSRWPEEDLIFSLQIGMLPDGDFLGGSMGHVIDNSTGRMSDEDLKAIATYLRSLED